MLEQRWKAVFAGSDKEDLSGILGVAGCELIAQAESVNEALRAVGRCHPDLLFVDAEIDEPGAEELIRRVRALPLRVHPAIVLLQPQAGPQSDEGRLKGMNVKALWKPVSVDGLKAALGALVLPADALTRDRAKKLEAMLEDIGLPDEPARKYLMRAIEVVRKDPILLYALRDKVYPEVGRSFDRTGEQVERAIRDATDTAWRTGDIERQRRVFGDAMDAMRERPTCGELIALLADLL